MQLHPLRPQVTSWCPQGSWGHQFSLIFAGIRPCGFGASQAGWEKKSGVQV